MIPNLETLSDVSGASLWLREMALDFAGKYFSQLEGGDESVRKIRGHTVEKSFSSTM